MDVHQFALLARQPSAALTERQHFWGMPKRGLALILANALFWQPLLVQAEGIAVSGTGTTLGQAGNGVPIINIATPNASGLSHNQFEQYNVDSQGVILNNSTNQTQSTQLGGIIVGNSNLRGTAANTILNEVVGANASQLRGYTEVAGQAARVIVANPYGISCNGCGFINTPQVTLTTGKPILDANGQLQRFNVQGGSISIDGVGLNADNVDQFDIITRSAKINAELHAKRLNVITGRNDVDAQTLNPTALADDGSGKPELAIDSSALGGMYAGAIRLVGTEAGVGVRLAGDLAASGGDIQIDANGHLNVMQVAASGAVNVRANTAEVNGPVYAGSSLAMTTGGDLTTRQNVAARDALTLSAGGQLRNSAVIEAGVNADNSRNASGDVTLSANSLTNSGSITASRALQATVTQTLNNQGATLNGQARVWVAAGVIDNRQSGRILSQGGNADINASQILNAQSGLISSSGNLNITAQTLDNSQQGKLSSGAVLTARISGQVLNQLGIINAAGGLLLNTGTVDNRTGEISSLGNLTATLVQFDNSSSGRLLANGTLQLTADTLNNQNAGSVSGQQNVQLTLGQLTNTGKGSVYARNNLGVNATRAVNNDQGVLRSDGTLNLSAASLASSGGSVTSAGTASITTNTAVINQGGQILSDASLTLTSGSLDNSQSGRIAANGVTVTTGAFDNHKDGRLTSTGTLGLTAAQVNNTEAGRIASAMALTAAVTGLDQTNDGRLYSNSDVSLDLNNGVLNNQDGLINAPGQLLLKNLNVVNNQSGEISSANGFSLAATSLDNTEGSVLSDKALILRVNRLLTNLRGMVSANGLELYAATLNNQNAEISSLGALTATVGQFDNSQKGRLMANGTLQLTADNLDNQNAGSVSGQQNVQLTLGQLTNTGKGSVYARNSLGVTATRAVNNDQGVLRSDGTLNLSAASLASSGGSVTSAGTASITTTAAVVNQGGQMLSDASLTLTSGSLDNSQSGRIAANGVTVTTGAFDNHKDGRLTSTGTLGLTAAQVNNTEAGRIASAMALTAVVTGLDQTSDGRLYSNSDVSLDLNNGVLNNQDGLINAPGQLLLKNLNVVNNQSGEISSANGFSLAATSLDNTEGSVLSDKALILRVNRLLTNLRGMVSANGLELHAATLNNQNAEISSLGALTATVGQFDNSQKGRLMANGALLLTADSFDNQANGVVSGQQSVQLNLGELTNTGSGRIYGKNSLGFNIAGALNNEQGVIRSDGTLSVTAASLNNTSGSISSAQIATITATGAAVNNGGEVLSDASLKLTTGRLDNARKGRIAGNGIELTTGTFENQNSGSLISSGVMSLTAGQVNNSEAGRIASAMALTAVVTALDQTNDGRLYGNSDVSLDLSHGVLNNQGGLITAPGQLILKNLTTVNNRSGEISSANGFTLTANSMDNTAGSLISDKALIVRVDKLLNNLRGLISATGLELNAATLNNQNAEVSSLGTLTATVGQFDNSRKGRLLANGALLLTADSLDNQTAGVVSGQQSVQLNLGQLTNTDSGRIYGKNSLGFNVTDALNNSQGVVRSDGTLELKAASLNNTGGSITSADTSLLTVTGNVVSQGGEILSSADLRLDSASLDNSKNGRIAGKGVTVDTGAFDNQQGGRLTSTDVLSLTAAQVNNSEAGRIASAKALTAFVTGLDQSKDGRLYSNSDVSLDLNNGVLKNLGGLITAPGQLLLRNLTTVDNRNGEISSANGFKLSATSLDNTDGSVISEQALIVRVDKLLTNVRGLVSGMGIDLGANELNNNGGSVSSDDDLIIDVKDALSNQLGELTSAGKTDLASLSLDNTQGQVMADKFLNMVVGKAINNQAGTLGSGQGVDIHAVSLDNSQSGSVVTDGKLSLVLTGALDNQTGGSLQAKGLMDLSSFSVDNRGGSIIARDLLIVHSDSVANRGGAIRAEKGMQLFVDELDNNQADLAAKQKGGIQSNAGLELKGTFLDNRSGLLNAADLMKLQVTTALNDSGRVASQADLVAEIDSLTQKGGELVAQGDLTLIGKTLDNRSGGLVSATKALKLNVDDIDNRNGEISSQIGVDITAKTLENSDGGKVLAGTALELEVARIINLNKGLLFGNTLHLDGARLDNAGGTLASQNNLTVLLTDALDNTGGLLSSEAALSVTADSLQNAGGSLSSADALKIDTTGALFNQSGSVTTDSTLTIFSASLDNSQGGALSGKGATKVTVTAGTFDNSQKGRLTSSDTLELTAGKVINQSAGRIASALALTATVTRLDQQAGEMFSNTSLSLDLNNGQLNNQGGLINASGLLLLKNLKGVANQNGEISSNQAFIVKADSLDNSGGKLLSGQKLTLVIDEALANVKGSISAAALDMHSAVLDNTTGLISSRGALDLTVDTALNNTKGVVIADADVELYAASVDNLEGQLASKKNLVAHIGNLQQKGGQLIAQGSLTLTGDALTNSNKGLIGATQALSINVADIDNRGGEISGQDTITLTGAKLNNSDSGQVLAQKALKLNVAQTTNQNDGLLSSTTGLTVVGTALDNTGGTLSGLQDINIDLSGLLDNTKGLVSSEGKLTLKAGSLTNTAGNVSSADTLYLRSVGAFGNQGGKLVTDGALDLGSGVLDNSQRGTISSKGLLKLTTGDFDNSQNGRVSTGDRLELTAAKLTNSSGGSIGSSQAMSASVSRLDQQKGTLFSNTSLSLDLNNGQLDNQSGLINAPGTLLLKNLGVVLNQGGEISSGQAFTLSANNLENNGGKVLSNQVLTLRIANALNNVKGMIAAAGVDTKAGTLDNTGGTLTSRNDLELTVTGTLTNREKGLINANQFLELGSGVLDNQTGQLLAKTGLTLDATTINNTADGLINSGSTLVLTANSLNSGNGGEVSALGAMSVTLDALSLDSGRLMGNTSLSIDLKNADLDNRGGLVSAKGPLTFKRVRDFINQSGEISSSQSFELNGRALDNTNGKVISSDVLTVATDSVNNQNGLLSGWQRLEVRGKSLDNRNNGTLSSRNGSVGVDLSGALLNSGGGALVSQTALTVTSDSLNNSGGILSSGAGQTLTVTGRLDNSQKGLIDSGAGLTIKAATLDNTAGNLTAAQDLSFEGGTLDNSVGNLSSRGAMTLDLLAALTNTNGKLASGGALLLRRSTQINNQGGQLVSKSLLTLNTAGQLDNSNRGTLASDGKLHLIAAGNVVNATDGLIYSQGGDVEVDAAGLDNKLGTLQSQGALRVSVNKDVDNLNGRIIAQGGDLGVTAANLNSQGGVLSSLQGAFTSTITGVLNNGYDGKRQGGVIQAQRLNLTALGGFNNYGGRVSARTGEALITTADFDNRNGGLYAKGLVRVKGVNFDNSGDNDGQIAGSQIELDLGGLLNNRLGIIESDSTLNIRAANLDNQTGQLRALGAGGSTLFQIGNQFDNRSGRLEVASSDLTLNAASFLNANGSLLHTGEGTFAISTPNLTNAGGSVVTRGGLTLAADSWTNSSVIQAGRLTVNVGTFNQTASGQLLASNAFVGTGGNWINDGLIASDGSVDIRIGGGFSGSGRVSSAGIMGMSAAQIDLNSATAITAGTTGTITSTGTLGNFGRLTSMGDLTVNAASLNNQGTLGSSGNLRVNAGSLVNQNGLVFSGGNMALRVGDFTNRFADVYSLGNLSIARDDSNGWSSSINNVSATIESGGDLTLATDYFENRKDVFEAAGGLVSGAIGVQCYACTSYRLKAESSHMVWVENYSSKVLKDSAPSYVVSGRDLVGLGRKFVNDSSSLSAGRNLDFNLQDFTNKGSVVGDYTLRRSFEAREDLSYWYSVMAYNAANDPYYESENSYINGKFFRANIHLWTADGVESIQAVSGRGRESSHVTTFGWIWVPTETGEHAFEPPVPQYINGGRTEAPDSVKNANFFENIVVTNNPSSSANAVVQAGGTVRINATQNLTNSVVREGITIASGGSRVGGTQLSGSAKPTVVSINGQLPPDLAQQQVNPLALPGFSLPTGQNGLFRLSGQSGNTSSISQATGTPQSWTMGGASISLAQREQSVPDAQPGIIQLGAVGQIDSATRQLALTTRQAAGVSANASTFDTSAPGFSNAGGFILPGHSSDAAGVTLVDTVAGVTASNQGNGALLPVQSNGSSTAVPLITAASSSGGTIQNPGAVQGGAITSVTQVIGTSVASQIPTSARPPVIAQANQVTSAAQPVVVSQSNAISPVAGAASQTVAKVQGLPNSTFVSKPQKYLIETNPVLTELKQFMSSDYLLAGLGYDPEVSAKRLGDGLYEQRLVQQAVVARTGQAFIQGQTSNEAQFKYLMNNAIASKQQLNLAVGVSLSSQQVAALTHDIVWLEEHEVNGEKVLVPVLYLAQADNRLGPTGALIAGNDVSLIAGQNLDNVGTLLASNNLSAVAGNNLVNAGLIEAGNRLDLLAGNDLINTAGGIIKGRDVSLTSLNGDVINERSITSMDNDVRGQRHSEFADSAARIEAANDMSISAGRDFINRGSVLESGRDLNIVAGRDLSVGTTEVNNSLFFDKNHNSSDITQLGSTVTAGRDLGAKAGRDISLIASDIDAKRDIAMAATANMTISSAADEEHSLSKSKKLTRQEDHVSQIATDLNAGGSVVLQAGQNLAVISSRITAGQEAYLVAGENLDILAAQDSDYSLYEKKKKGSFGAKSFKRDEVTDVKNIGSEITTGGDLVLASGGDQKYQVAKLESGKDLTIESGGAVTFEGVKDLHDESHTKSKNDAFWTSSKGKGNTDETLRQTQMSAKGSIAINAVNGLAIDVKQIDQQTVSQSIDAMVKADPQLAWLKQAEARGDVDWRLVKEVHESFKYQNSGLGPASQLIIAIALAAVMGPMMASLNAMVQAGAVSVATKATVSTIDNRGNLGRVLKDVTSKDSIKGYAVAVATAGVADGLGYTPDSVDFDIPSAKAVALKITADAVIKTAVYGGSFADNLASSFVGTAASIGGAVGAGQIGNSGFADGGLVKILLHAGLGGLLAEAMGGDFRAGAFVGGANEVLVGLLGDKLLPSNLLKGTREYEQAQANLLALSQIVAVLGATAVNSDAQVAAAVAANATQYNWLLHSEIRAADEARAACGKMGGNVEACQANITRGMDELDKARDYELKERKRLIQLQSFKDGGWSLGEYNKALFDDYFALKGVDPSQVTFNGYAPAKTLGYMLSERGIGSINEAIQWPGKIVDSLAGLAQPINTAVGAAKDIWSAANSGVEWATSPIPAQGLERIGDQLLAQSDQQAGALIFDVATGLITSVSGGIVTKWIGGRWVTAAANDKNLTTSFVDADAGPKGSTSVPVWASSEGSYSGKPVGGYPDTVPATWQIADDVGGVGSGLGPKGSTLGLVPGDAGVVGTGKTAAKDANFDGPKNTSSEIDQQKLELLTSHPNAHSLGVHGGNVTDGDLMVRAKTGVKPDGAIGPSVPPLSSAFHSDDLLVQADQFVRNNALQKAIARNPGSDTVRVTADDVGDVGADLGRGFKRIWSSGNTAKNLEVLGAPAKVSNLRSVEGVYQFNPGKNVWETITIFPAPLPK
ncbi:filamentous hemagglutinin N-terminal domain-containing protein [Pseudomonas viridiflava]|uniref:two-partner secretion domain-containing protein n=1 Tax=Pseudomonas viridiflava TaxID=33069 RepID=UPI001F120093|nr:filamentous hemagglutinin N-terminal domain-containing protein [Pseudomonas viridiflava]